MKVSLLRKQNKRYVKAFGMQNITIDLCRYLTGTLSSNFMNLMSSKLKEHSNILRPCPFVVRFPYLRSFSRFTDLRISFQGNTFIKDYHLRDNFYPSSAEGQFAFQLVAFKRHGNRDIFITDFKLFFGLRTEY